MQKRVLIIVLLILLVVVVSVDGYLAVRIIEAKIALAVKLKNQINQIQEMKDSLTTLEFAQAIGPSLTTLQQDVSVLKLDLQPWLGFLGLFNWVPQYGNDISMIGPFLDVLTGLSSAAENTYRSMLPVMNVINGKTNNSNLTMMTRLFLEAQPKLAEATQEIDLAISARSKIDISRLSPSFRDLISKKIDPYLSLFKQGLTIITALPGVMGTESRGPQTYLLLIQNEDELRATGGFITAIGILVVKDGELISSTIEDSYAIDDLTKPYPLAPWQLERYMNSLHWVFRDSNWSPDFPTSAAIARYLYSFKNTQTINGVFAIDQKAVSIMLDAVGPVVVEGASDPITSETMVSYIRGSKDTAIEEGEVEHRKDSIGIVAEAILKKIINEPTISWMKVIEKILKALNEHHFLLSFDDPIIKDSIAKLGWDGSISAGEGDFLMVVDSNVGFTKSNAVVEMGLTYNVDLSNLSAITSSLKIVHKNLASKDISCHMFGLNGGLLYRDQIDRCYWDYLRVYKPKDTELVNSSVHSVPAEWTISNIEVPAQVDILDENIQKVNGFGTYLVVPGGEKMETSFQFLLPSSVIINTANSLHEYHLRIEKQPGTSEIPIQIIIHLPPGVESVESNLITGKFADGSWTISTTLNQDIDMNLRF